MKNQVQEGDILALPAPYAVAAGGGALIGSVFGVAITPLESGQIGNFMLKGVFTQPKAAGSNHGGAQGTKAYWIAATKNVTAVASSNTLIGVFTATCADGDTSCTVRLNGSF